MIEPNEANRLTELYANMAEGELEKVASESYELTEIAREALRIEIQKRGLDFAIREQRPEKIVEPVVEETKEEGYYDADFQKLVFLRRFRDLPEAMLAKGTLASSGIEGYFVDDNIVRMDWFISNLIGGVKLMVRPEDLEAANDLLSQPIPEGIDYGGDEQFEQPKCPKCSSIDITFEELNKPLSYASAWVGFPLPVSHPNWKCESCGAKWVEEEDSAQEGGPQP
jgi:hypothetical protein